MTPDDPHRLMARELEMSPLAAEIILQALRHVVHEHYEIEALGPSMRQLTPTIPEASNI